MLRTSIRNSCDEEEGEDDVPNSHMQVTLSWGHPVVAIILFLLRVCLTPCGRLVVTESIHPHQVDKNSSYSTCWFCRWFRKNVFFDCFVHLSCFTEGSQPWLFRTVWPWTPCSGTSPGCPPSGGRWEAPWRLPCLSRTCRRRGQRWRCSSSPNSPTPALTWPHWEQIRGCSHYYK